VKEQLTWSDVSTLCFSKAFLSQQEVSDTPSLLEVFTKDVEVKHSILTLVLIK
jgi:DeoR/GlpR family transcriptional regulator of sugar metabolism